MLSGIMQTLLVKFLGRYVDGLKNNIDVGFTGNTTIQKISLKPEFINQLGLPFTLKYSHISKIVINVPWANLKQKPTTVTVQGIYVLLALKYDDIQQDRVNPRERFDSIFSRVKQELKKKIQEKDANKTQSFAEKSIIRIIDNLVINIDQIHVRVESMKRNWDFSFGVILDKISSVTVNQYGQKIFYTRHFTNKQLNPPLKKSFICERFQIYFNDKQEFFMCERQQKNKDQVIKGLLAQPFAKVNIVKKKDSSPQKNAVLQFKPSYEMKILSRFSFDIIAEQKLSADKKYIVQTNGQLPKVCLQITDIQLSQILVVLQLIYEWILDKQKNGRKNIIFDEKSETQFKKILIKRYKEQRLTEEDFKILNQVLIQVPLQKLENAADNLIKQYRIDRQMKKIQKIQNKQKSKQLMQKLLQRIQNQNQQALEYFQHITIQLAIPQFKISCIKDDKPLLEIGFNSIMSDIKLVLTKHTLVTINVSQPFIKILQESNQLKNLIITDKQQYARQPFIQFAMTKLNKTPPIIKFTLKKRHIEFTQQAVENLITWINRIRIKPPLINFLSQQINYSVHITQQIFAMLFKHPDLKINFNLQVPLISLKFQELLQLNYGSFSINRQSQKQYSIQTIQDQLVAIGGQTILQLQKGTRIVLVDMKPETVKIQVPHLTLKNIHKMFKFARRFLKNPIIQKVKALSLAVQQQTIFQGKFLLNQYQTPQNMLMKGSSLIFFPSNQKVSLLRTKMYPFQKKGKYGLVFRQQVQKEINIVLMDSQKLMYTLFETIKQQILYICTLSQWKRYYQKFSDRLVTEISQIQKKEQNVNLIDLFVDFQEVDVLLGQTKLGETLINAKQFNSIISYRQFNTDAKSDIGCINLTLGKQRLIQNLSIALKYSYIQHLNFFINVLSFRLNIENYEVIEQIINLSTEYSLMFELLISTFHEVYGPPAEEVVIQEKAKVEDISYLLESKIVMELNNMEAYIIGFRNMIKNSIFTISKYRYSSIPNIMLSIKNLIFMTTLTLSNCQLAFQNNKLDINIANLAIYLSFQLVFYQLTTGRGHHFLDSLINLIKAKRESIKQNTNKVQVQRTIPSVNLNIKGFKTRFRLTQNEQLSTYISNTMIMLNKDEKDKNILELKVLWNRFELIINSNVILQPLSGTMQLRCLKSGTPLQVTSQIEPIIINISVHKLIQSAIVIKISLQRILNLQIIRHMLVQKLKATNPRVDHKLIQQRQNKPRILLQVQSVRVILYNFQDWKLIRVRVEEIGLDTDKGMHNQVEIGIQHLNSVLRVYEPVLEKTKIIMSIQDGPQAHIKFKDIRFNFSEEFVKDIIKELIITKQNVQKSLKQVKFDVNQQASFQNQIQKFKSIISRMIVPQQFLQFQSQQKANEQGKPQSAIKQKDQKQKKRSQQCILFIHNNIHAEILLQISLNEKNQHKLHLKEDQTQQIKFMMRSQYHQSYQMIQKYKKIIIKLSFMHKNFYAKSLYFSLFLFKQAYNYHQAKFTDETNQEYQSAIGIYVHHQLNSVNYIMDIISPFKIINLTSFNFYLNWLKGQKYFKRELKENEEEWVSPWVNQKVNIDLGSDNIYASSCEIFFDKPHSLYQISLNNPSGQQPHNYCCLTIQKQPFKLEKWSKQKRNNSLKVQPSSMIIKPTYFVINHFHTRIIVNDTQCNHKQKVPLYSMFRVKNQSFFKIKLGDGSMHQVYLPKDGKSNSVQLKLKNDNFVTIFIFREKSLQNTNLPNRNECIYHIFSKLELLVSLPKAQNLTLMTSIYSTKYILKKQIILNDTEFEHKHPCIIQGQKSILTKDRFIFHTYVHVLEEYQKYLTIKSQAMYSKQVTLYPSYYGNDINFYKSQKPEQPGSSPKKQQQKHQQILKKYSINYQFTKIGNQIIMYYVSILPKYYILNLSLHNFNIDAQGVIRFNERIVVDSDSVEVAYIDAHLKWQMLSKTLGVNLSNKKEIIFFRQLLFSQHQFNKNLKNKRLRKMSREVEKSQGEQFEGYKNLYSSQRLENVPVPAKKPQDQQQPEVAIIQTQNIKIFQVLKHMGSFSATTFCIKQWNQWINIHNNLNYTIVAATKYKYDELQISFQTKINPGLVGTHPYGMENMPNIQFYILEGGQKVYIGSYETNLRFNDEIQLILPSKEDEPARTENIAMYEVRVKKGRKVVFSLLSGASQEQTSSSSKKLRSLIIPAFLKISQSLKINIQNVSASVIVGQQSNRRELIRLCSRNIDLLLLAYPSGLYMVQIMLSLQIQAPHFPQLVLNVPNIQFYLQAVQGKFIQRVTLKVPKQITAFLTDKLIIDILGVVNQNIKSINNEKQIFKNSNNIVKQQQSQGFYTSSLNSVMISQIHAKVTVKKVIIEDNEKKLLQMGLSIIQLQGSSIKLSKFDIQQPINTNHLNTITKKYVMQIIMGCLGGLNLIGNPHQFMQEIQAGRMRGKPIIGFVGGIFAGATNSVSKILSTVGNGVSNLSMDYQYQRQRNQSYMNQPKGFANGIKHGSKSLMSSLKSGVVGLFSKPKQGLKEEGGIGLIKGTFEGLTGLIVKPVTGLMDAASMTVQGIKSVSSYNEKQQDFLIKLQKPLYHKFRVIRPFDKTDDIIYNSLVRVYRQQQNSQKKDPELIQAFILQNQYGKQIQQAVIITSEKLYLINYIKDEILMQIRHEKMGATAQFLEGVVLYFDDSEDAEEDGFSEKNDNNEIVFRITNPKKKFHLYKTLDAFIHLYAQSRDKQKIPDE